MITTNIIWIILFLSVVLIVAGVYLKKKALILVLFGGLLLLLTGILTFTDPISLTLINNSYIYDNGTLTNIVETLEPTPINTQINNVLTWTMILLGLACAIGSSIKLYDSKYDEDDPEQIRIFDD